MKGATTPPVLRWPKLFEGRVKGVKGSTPHYSNGIGYGYGFGYGDGSGGSE
jgi:hypothetical protein